LASQRQLHHRRQRRLLWIVDQHVAHERVLFDSTSPLAAPQSRIAAHAHALVLDLSPRQIVIFEKIAEEMSANGLK